MVGSAADEAGMPDVCGFEENLDWSQFDQQQPPPLALRRIASSGRNGSGETS
jgi:hypothetical protein